MIGKNRARWQCRACNKISFGSESRALETMGWAQEQGNRVPVRAYPCPKGNGYHLSSQEERAWAG